MYYFLYHCNYLPVILRAFQVSSLRTPTYQWYNHDAEAGYLGPQIRMEAISSADTKETALLTP